MDEEHLSALPRRLQSRWTEGRKAEVRSAIAWRVRRRRGLRVVVAGSSLVLAGGLMLAMFAKSKPSEDMSTESPASTTTETRTTVAEPAATPLTADTELAVDPQGRGRAFVLRRGGARFVVTHDERQPFRVRAGALVIEDLGTVFSVARLSESEFDIAVEEGQVAVLCQNRRAELGSGQRRTFTCGAPETPNKAEWPSPTTRPHTRATPAWRVLAEKGEYRQAYDVLRQKGEASVRDEANDLLLAADTARLSGHPNEAVPYLRLVLTRHGGDPRSPLAAFTLGRVLLDELGRPAEAAEAFARVRSRHGPLAEDALAREIEAWARAGDGKRAHALALEYRRGYPQGRRLPEVTRFGGLE
jgi:transmembrane sensor